MSKPREQEKLESTPKRDADLTLALVEPSKK